MGKGPWCGAGVVSEGGGGETGRTLRLLLPVSEPSLAPDAVASWFRCAHTTTLKKGSGELLPYIFGREILLGGPTEQAQALKKGSECGFGGGKYYITWGADGAGEKGEKAARDVNVVSTALPGAARAVRNQSTTLAATTGSWWLGRAGEEVGVCRGNVDVRERPRAGARTRG